MFGISEDDFNYVLDSAHENSSLTSEKALLWARRLGILKHTGETIEEQSRDSLST
jgi:hypothetical protein